MFQVNFVTAVSIAQHPKINEWLTYVEKEMRVTLAKLLAQAVKDIGAFKSGKIDPKQYLEWVDKYQVCYNGEVLRFLCPCIDRFGAYSFWPVCPSVCPFVCGNFTLTLTFECQVIELSHFTYIYSLG